jgi:hypothetical protein
VDSGRLVKYEAEKKKCGLVVHFPLYQKVDKPSPSLLPDPPEDVALPIVELLLRHGRFRADYSKRVLRLVGEGSAKVRRIIEEGSQRSRARALEQGAGSREQGAGSPKPPGGAGEGDQLYVALRKSEALRGLSWEQDLTARKVWEGWYRKFSSRIAEALADRATVDMPDAPGAWLRRQYEKLARAEAGGEDLATADIQQILQGGFLKKERGGGVERPMVPGGGVG